MNDMETSGKSRLVRNAIIVAVILVAAIALNPNKQRHDEALRKKVADRSPIAGMLGVGRAMSWMTSYHSLGIASYTKSDDRVISIGALGLVWVRLPSGD